MTNPMYALATSSASAEKSNYALTKKRIVIGSATSCDLRIDDPSISPIHGIFEVDLSTGKAVLYDLASDAGTTVNGKTIVQADVKMGDAIRLGNVTVEFKLFSDSEAVKEKTKTGPIYNNEPSPFLIEERDSVSEIFDYSPEANKSLQVVMFYISSILEVSHFTKKKKVVLGPKKSDDFGVPPLFGNSSPASYELVTVNQDHYELNLHDSMTGVIHQNGEMKKIADILKKSDSKIIPLSEKDFAKVSMGDVSFFVNFTPAPPRLKPQRLFAKDAFFSKVWITSLVLTFLFIFTLTKITVNPQIEIEELPERIATIIYKPELLPIEQPKPKPKPTPVDAEKTPPKPKPEPKKEVIKVTPKEVKTEAPKDAMIGKEEPKKPQPKKEQPKAQAAPAKPKQAAATNMAGNEGAGARAKGDNGTRGKPNAKQSDVSQTKAQRPGTGPKNAPANARPGNSQVQDLGVVDVFKSSGGTLAKMMAGGKGASGAADKLEGYGGFTTKGAGGLGDAGSGSGGGGESLGLGGLADKGVGGGKKGTGLGALGSGGNIIGGKGKLIIAGSNGAPEPIVLGAIDTDAIAREIAKHRDEIKYCYEKEINAENPDLAGKINIKWVIGASGAVTTAGVVSTTMKNPNVEGCVVDVIKRIVFPPVKGGGIAEVTYPFVFRPANQ